MPPRVEICHNEIFPSRRGYDKATSLIIAKPHCIYSYAFEKENPDSEVDEPGLCESSSCVVKVDPQCNIITLVTTKEECMREPLLVQPLQ